MTRNIEQIAKGDKVRVGRRFRQVAVATPFHYVNGTVDVILAFVGGGGITQRVGTEVTVKAV